MMSLMCIMLLSAATYAWFSLSNAAKMSNLTMTVGAAKGLQIADDPGSSTPADTAWTTSINAPNVKGKLMPATYDGGTFYKPEYNDDGEVESVTTTNVVELTSANDDANKEGNYYTMTFYMKSVGADSQVCLVQGTDLASTSRKGTYVVNNVTAAQDAAAAIRIAITVGSTTKVYEPNADTNFTGNFATINYSPKKSDNVTTIMQSNTGAFTNSTGTGNSDPIFSLTKDEATKVTLHIWIEGEDAHCVNEIQLGNLIGQLQFEQVS